MTFDQEQRGWFGTSADREAVLVIGFAIAVFIWSVLTNDLRTAHDILLITHGLTAIVFLGGLVRSAWKK